MKIFDGIEELRGAVGSRIGTSSWHTITQGQIDRFAEATGDDQWIHVDPERAAAGPFGTTIAHGFLTLSLLSSLTFEVYQVKGVSASLNYGANKVRFPTPVPVDTRVRASIDLIEVVPNGTGFQVETRVVIEREGCDKPACVVEMLAIVVP